MTYQENFDRMRSDIQPGCGILLGLMTGLAIAALIIWLVGTLRG